ncbi:MAG: hypothetical protein AB8G26_20725 [Ilumatobacter sp.]
MATVDDFTAAGLFDPAVDADTGRLELLEWLDALGFTVVEMCDALEQQALGALAGDRRLVPGERLTRTRAVDLASVPGESFDENVAAFGFVPVEGSPAGEIGFTADEARTMAAFHVLGDMFTPEEATSLLRVVGSSIGRIAEAAVSLFLSDVESQSIEAGESEIALARKVYDGVGLLDGFMERLDPVLRRHVLQAIERTRATTISESERFQFRYAVGFVDLVGFTGISAEMSTR